MEVANAVRHFRAHCERIIADIARKRPPTKDEAWIIQFYCKQLLSQIEPYLPQQSTTA